jgi:hypothetical protein
MKSRFRRRPKKEMASPCSSTNRDEGNGSPPFRSGNYYYSVAYWYQTETHKPFPPMPSVQERIGWAAVPKAPKAKPSPESTSTTH